MGAKVLFDEQVDRIAQPPKILAEDRAERGLVRIALEQGLAIFGKESSSACAGDTAIDGNASKRAGAKRPKRVLIISVRSVCN
jgi:hypothetical protein